MKDKINKLEKALESFEESSTLLIDHFETKIEQLFQERNITPEQEQASTSEVPEFINCLYKTLENKWYIQITIYIQDNFTRTMPALVDTGADVNCIQEDLIPKEFFEETSHKVITTTGERLRIKYKISNVLIQINDYHDLVNFILVKTLGQQAILGIPFLKSLVPFTMTSLGIKKKKILFEFL